MKGTESQTGNKRRFQNSYHTEMATLNTVRNRNPLKCLFVKVICLIVLLCCCLNEKRVRQHVAMPVSAVSTETEPGLLYALFSAFPSTRA